jgi:multidrug resistance efflux pump
MSRFRTHTWRRTIFLSVLAGLLAYVVRETLRPPATIARPRDVERAARDLPPPDGGTDFRQPLSLEVTSRYVAGNARVEPRGRERRVSSEVPGLVRAILVKEGDTVAEGSPLIQLNAAVERAAVDAARAEQLSERASLERTLAGARPLEREAAEADARAADARAALSDENLQRLEPLGRTGAATPQELDKARRDAEFDKASAAAAEERARLTKAGSRREDIALARARYDAATARLAQAQATLAERTVVSPLAGTILSVPARPGEYFTPQESDPMVIVGDLNALRVRMEVDERQIGRVHTGARAFVTADAFPDQKFWGTVTDIGHRMGRKSIHTDLPSDRADAEVLELLIDLDKAGPLLPGLRVTAYVDAGQAGHLSG